MIDVVEALWSQIEPAVFISREQFTRELEEWEIEPVEINGALAFAVLTKGPELHFASFGTGAPISLVMIKARIDPLLERYGFVTVRTPKNDVRQHRFNKRFGFKQIGSDEFFTYFRMDRRCL
jgi:hypothetical protein